MTEIDNRTLNPNIITTNNITSKNGILPNDKFTFKIVNAKKDSMFTQSFIHLILMRIGRYKINRVSCIIKSPFPALKPYIDTSNILNKT